MHIFNSKIQRITVAVLAAAWGLVAAAQPPVPNDPTVRTGVLSNGLTYYVKQNNYPPRHADFFIAQRVGSIQEEESQRGLAHFLEHMCFNGTKHFPGNSLITYMESVGVKFGANLNAYTSTDQTVYNISNVPTARAGVLDTCLLVLSDWSHDLLLRDKDIDEERGVIEGEWRHRSGANNRILEKVAPVIYQGNLYGERLPIGLMSVVKNFKYKELKNYYKKWYHPGNQAVIVVGDIDPDAVVAQIVKRFGGIKRPKNAPAVVPVAVPDNEQLIVAVATDKELTQNTVRLLFKHDDLDASLLRTTASLRRDYLKSVAATMLRARFDDLKQEAGAPFTGVVASDRDFMISKTRQAFQVVATAKPGRETECVAWMEREVNRALAHGFTDGEYRRARANYEAAVEKLYRERDKYTNTRYARDLVDAFIDGEAFPSIDTYRTLMRGVIDGVTTADVNDYFKSVISPTDRNVVLLAYCQDGDALPAADDLAAAFRAARAEATTPFVDSVKTDRLLATLPVAGTITAQDTLPQLGARVWTLSNGVKVFVKKTDLNPDEVIVAGAAPGGLSQNYTAAQAPSFKAINAVMAVSGYGAFTQSDLKKALAGKNVKSRTFVSKTEEGFQVTTTPADLETALQLNYLKLTSPQKDEKAFAQYLEQQRVRLQNQHSDPKFEFADSLFAHVFRHHPLAAEKLLKEEVDRVDYDCILDCYRDRFADVSDMNVFIVGNFDEDSLRTLVCRYIASLPGNGRVERPRDIDYRLFSRDTVVTWSRHMENPQDKVYFFWTGTMPMTLRNSLLAKMTGQIFSAIYRQEIREDRGWTYHVDTHMSLVDNHNGDDAPVIYFPLNVTVTAGCGEATRDIVRGAVQAVARDGVTAAQLDKVKQYLKKVHTEDVTDNSYWMVMLKHFATRGQDFHHDYLTTIDAITPAHIQQFVREHIAGGPHLELLMTPAP